MKNARSLLVLAAFCLAGAAHAQSGTQEMQFPGTQPKSSPNWSPPATLRMTVDPSAPAAEPIRDTPESIAEYQRCRTASDRAAVSNEQRTAGAAACLKALQDRRQPR
ncbi:hypothetical protein AW878_13045 [Bordetella pseudohinzii]|uniref:Uncharacterized protein n=2 Tax=Bordetella pseudohinzii TaxID=1331258 RepID=A0A0J6BZM5_9BORD|nr:hypothetical protein [Bordetella pseudohinzii]ANY16996.1 hypothetical protein BBN53_14605 [Bordetella pseudohinzii]KMM24178.1 hypothetical protein L540_07890 [Bordetella pseudohinzii]KXA78305.1 hypothetical protein AW877_11875 [Bordetella pseudohinzii]KXA78421.1 hypothetical protein AW878_13045 [Bordetella pseudohinzii]CUJ11770.1 Uncharacterised protein [Bordetella pseudohinzii]